MISAVLTFAFITAIGEAMILWYFPGFRNFILRGKRRQMFLHLSFAALNLWIHWGTITGSMTAVTALVVSIIVVWLTSQITGVKPI